MVKYEYLNLFLKYGLVVLSLHHGADADPPSPAVQPEPQRPSRAFSSWHISEK